MAKEAWRILRKVTLFIGLALMLFGIIFEAIYITTSNVAYSGNVGADSYLVMGILFIIVGFILTLTSVKIPKVRVP
ncbi:hypothetical protein J2P12_03765 [Candidatus Bathyarchaeota archaeon]|nr:hypothetical protein [Candidatus Bathyarchaeota archaeon]